MKSEYEWPLPTTIILVVPLFILGVGHGSAWYWSEITGRKLTPELTDFSTAFTAFYVALEYVFLGIKKYIAKKTEGIGDAEAKERKRSKLDWILTSLALLIIGSIGWLVLQLVHG